MGEMKNAYETSVGKCEGKRPFGKPRKRRKDVVDWVHLAQDRDQLRALVNLQGSIKGEEISRITISFSRRTMLHEVRLRYLAFKQISVL